MIALLEPVITFLARQSGPVETAAVKAAVPPDLATNSGRSHRHAVWHALVTLERRGQAVRSHTRRKVETKDYATGLGVWSVRTQRVCLWQLTPQAQKAERLVKIECKDEKGVVTDEQKEWLEAYRRAGVEAHVWRPRDLAEVYRVLA